MKVIKFVIINIMYKFKRLKIRISICVARLLQNTIKIKFMIIAERVMFVGE